MKKTTATALFAVLASGAFAVPSASVTEVSRNVETRAVTVAYSIAGTEPAVVTFDVTTNGVSVGGAALRAVAGDVNRLVKPGSHSFVWMPIAGGVSFAHDNVKVVLQTWATNAPPPYMTVDLVAKSNVLFYASADALPFDGGVTNDWCKSRYLVMRRIPAAGKQWRKGSGNSSDHNPYELVTMSADYYIGIYSVTQNQYVKMGFSNNSSHKGDLLPVESSADFRPISGITYASVTETVIPAFTAFTGVAFRPPTAAEWEYACRAGTSTGFNNGTNDNIDPLGWYSGNAQNHPRCVGLKLPNSWGLYDMHGNVFEWCSDLSGSDHVLHGGSFMHSRYDCSSTHRVLFSGTNDLVGFRLVCPCEVPSSCY